jgi:hypothetical protein
VKTEESSDPAPAAGLEFVCRDLRLHHPDGTFDEGGRFYPSDKEGRLLRFPSSPFPNLPFLLDEVRGLKQKLRRSLIFIVMFSRSEGATSEAHRRWGDSEQRND